MDTRSTEVTRDGHLVPMSAKEFQLLRYLLEHPNITLSREELLREVWGYDSHPSTRTVDVHVAWLRQKLGAGIPKTPQFILTVVGFGYSQIRGLTAIKSTLRRFYFDLTSACRFLPHDCFGCLSIKVEYKSSSREEI